MSFADDELIERLHAVARELEMPPASLGDDVRRGRRRVRRNRRRWAGAALATIVLIVASGAALGGRNLAGSDRVKPLNPPRHVVAGVPVWYDADGLHHGAVVEQTPARVGKALALVRSGAVYLEPATGDVWFHPWGGTPRVIGHNSESGPGGDPNGDTAVWFEGSEEFGEGPGDLVVYNTATGREISRTPELHGAAGASGDYYPAGNQFLQVSPERVVWWGGSGRHHHDVRARSTSVGDVATQRPLSDLHDEVEVFGEYPDQRDVLVLAVPGRAEQRFFDVTSHVRLSPTGDYLLGVEVVGMRQVAVIIDVRAGSLWRVPKDGYPWIAWSYGDLAMVDTDDALLACHAVVRTCDTLPAKRPFLLPTN